jgi:hypothetical protein
VAQGQARILSSDSSQPNVIRQTVTTSEADEFLIHGRWQPDSQGQARIGIVQTKDDGVPLSPRHQMRLRVDRDPRWGCAVDVQFGEGELDEQVHGFVAGGASHKRRTVDHHFRQHLPRKLGNAKVFTGVVQGFLEQLSVKTGLA